MVCLANARRYGGDVENFKLVVQQSFGRGGIHM